MDPDVLAAGRVRKVLMVKRSATTDAAQFSRLFSRWRAIVEMFAEDHSGQEQMDEGEYRVLHAALMGLCRGPSAESGADDLQCREMRRMETLIAPWLDLESFRQAAPAIVKDVLAKADACRAGREYPRARSGTRAWKIAGFGLLFAVVFVMLLGGDLLAQVQRWMFGIGSVQDSMHVAWDKVVDSRGHSASWLIGVAAVAFTGLMAYVVFRAPRSY